MPCIVTGNCHKTSNNLHADSLRLSEQSCTSSNPFPGGHGLNSLMNLGSCIQQLLPFLSMGLALKPETAFACLDFGSTAGWRPALLLGLDLCSNLTPRVPSLNKGEWGYWVMLLTASWGISFPRGVVLLPPFPQEQRSESEALVARFQRTAVHHLIIYILLASYLVPQLPSQMNWDNCFFSWMRDSL